VSQIAQASDLGSNPSVTTHRISRYVLLVESYEVLEAGSREGDTAEVQAGGEVQGYVSEAVQGLGRRMASESATIPGSSRFLQVRSSTKHMPHMIVVVPPSLLASKPANECMDTAVTVCPAVASILPAMSRT
jgi:hypothetical protein